MRKNYEFTGEEITKLRGNVLVSRPLKRIVAIRDLPWHNVKKGDLGGFIQFKRNLIGNGWVADDAYVLERAVVAGKALVSKEAVVEGNAIISGNAVVSGNALVNKNGKVRGYTKLYGNYFFENGQLKKVDK